MKTATSTVAPLLFLLSSRSLLAHGDNTKPHNLDELWRAWEFDPIVIIGLTLSAWLYARGLNRLWSATRMGSGVRPWQASAFAFGWFASLVALVSPLHPWGRVLFSAHMTQHEVLMLVSAPLMVLGRPIVIFLWAFPPKLARKASAWSKSGWCEHSWRLISNPFAAWLIHMVALWIWHVPALFEATIHSDWVHALQHISFLFSALLFWWAVMQGRHKMIGYGLAVLYMFTTALHSGILGALLTFTKVVWYPTYSETTASWGLTPIEDQQLGGLIMWIPAGLVYIIAALALFAGWLRASDERVQARETKASRDLVAKFLP